MCFIAFKSKDELPLDAKRSHKGEALVFRFSGSHRSRRKFFGDQVSPGGPGAAVCLYLHRVAATFRRPVLALVPPDEDRHSRYRIPSCSIARPAAAEFIETVIQGNGRRWHACLRDRTRRRAASSSADAIQRVRAAPRGPFLIGSSGDQKRTPSPRASLVALHVLAVVPAILDLAVESTELAPTAAPRRSHRDCSDDIGDLFAGRVAALVCRRLRGEQRAVRHRAMAPNTAPARAVPDGSCPHGLLGGVGNAIRRRTRPCRAAGRSRQRHHR